MEKEKEKQKRKDGIKKRKSTKCKEFKNSNKHNE